MISQKGRIVIMNLRVQKIICIFEAHNIAKNMDTLNRMPWAAKDSVFHKLAEIAEVSNTSKDERIKYDSALRHYH